MVVMILIIVPIPPFPTNQRQGMSIAVQPFSGPPAASQGSDSEQTV